MTTLANYTSVQAVLLCKVVVPNYQTLLFSSYNRPLTVAGDTYTNLGTLLGVTASSSDLRTTTGNMTISISGIPDASVQQIIQNQFKGSTVQVWRYFLDPVTGQALPLTTNPVGRFQGVVINWNIVDDRRPPSQDATCTINFVCSSTIASLTNKLSGRRTNGTDQRYWYSTDASMDRVISLKNSNFNFGGVLK